MGNLGIPELLIILCIIILVFGANRLPEIGRLSLTETAERAVRDYERKTGQPVTLTMSGVPSDAPLPCKIALYRLLQESLANSFRHAGGVGQRVTITGANELVVEIADAGPGFDPEAVTSDGRLGLVGMRERVEILGGAFEVESARGAGTVIRACLPLTMPEMDSE